uniref:Nodal modulator 1 n=1 Tax=Noccaea caerulescens TaxID=107243 RepID=A0A1J3G3W9_NOCCA
MAARTKICQSLIVFLIAISTVYDVSADSIKGCGGFVEASSSLVRSRKGAEGKLDYSHITVELQTVDGLVKDSTQCAPNGYYFIPVYDKGSFILKINGPEGWSWNPDKVPVVVDDSSCNNNEDINFHFTGFTLSGKVVGAVGGESCMVKNGGPADVNVELLSSDGDPIASVLTSSDGSYLFKNIIPGKYSIRASHPGLQIEVRGSTEVELGFANGVVEDIFFVLGYDLKGSVVAQGNPILGVHIYLHSDDVSMVDCPQGFGDASGERKPLCHAVSDVDGVFSFKSIPCGKYELVPQYKGENTVFDVSPSVMPIFVEHQHVTVPKKFQVTGFSIGGRVVDGNSMGVEGVKILVDGSLRSVTDNEGYYKLDQVTSNRYTIDAVKEHYKFDKLKKFMVLPNMASLPDITAVSYDICGVVQMYGSGHKAAKVALTHGPTNVKPQMKRTDESGTFCFEVPPGEYRLSALAATPKSASELLFLPTYLDVAVKSPLLNIEFSQARVNVHGSVTCKEKCGPSVAVALVGVASNRDKKTVVLIDESSQFHFSDILPGKYRVEVKSISPEAASEEDSWYWDRSSIDVNVGTEDIKGIEFVQKGYWITIISTHEVDAKIVHPNGSPTNLKIKKGSQKICVESPGGHELQLSDSCISFGSNSIKIDVSNLQPIHLKAEKYLLKGLVNVESSSTETESELAENIIVDMQDKEGSVINSISAKLASDGHGFYEYYTWANLGEKIIFVPRDSRGNVEKKMLFYPKELHAVVSNGGCQASVSPFTGRLGLYIKGSVSPPLPGVNIKVSAAKDSLISSLKKGEVAVETSTSADGLFVAGPLYDDIPYDTEASKPGYHIKRLGPYSFSCQKLGQISVRVFSKDNAETSVPPLLLSLSGDHGYRNNSISGAGGIFVFDSLFPGNFYLRPLLKEYSFKPSTLAIELGSGESSEAVFEATRVAYSAMGRVALLSGQPQEGVAIEARSDSKGYYEETTSDINGNYRLRGLHPDTTYVIKVSKKNGSGNNKIERASPESVSLQIGYEDTKGLDFLVFEQPETTLLTCHVQGKQNEEFNTNLQVEIKSAIDESKIESVFPLPLSNFFQVKGLSRGKHLLQLKSSRPSSHHRVESEIIEVDFETNPQIHVGPLRYSIVADHQSQEVTPAAILPLVIGVSAIALFLSIPRLKDMYQGMVGISSPGFSSSAKREPRKAVPRKKTF